MRLVRNPERRAITGVPDSTCYLLMDQGRYPKPVKLYGARAVAWVYDELIEWNQARAAERETTPAPASSTPHFSGADSRLAPIPTTMRRSTRREGGTKPSLKNQRSNLTSLELHKFKKWLRAWFAGSLQD